MTVEEKFIQAYCKELGLRWGLQYISLANGKRGFHINVVDESGTVQYFFESDYSEHMTEYYLRRQVARKAVAVLTRAVEKRAAEQALLKQAPTPNLLLHQVWPPADSPRCLPLTALRAGRQPERLEPVAVAVSATDIAKWRRKPPPQAVQ